MSSVERAKSTQIENIQKKTGKSMLELTELIQSSGLSKHSEVPQYVDGKARLGLRRCKYVDPICAQDRYAAHR